MVAQSFLTFLGIVNTPIVVQLFVLSALAMLCVGACVAVLVGLKFLFVDQNKNLNLSSSAQKNKKSKPFDKSDAEETPDISQKKAEKDKKTDDKADLDLSPDAATRAAQFKTILNKMDRDLETLDGIFELLPDAIASELEKMEQNKKQTDAEIEVLRARVAFEKIKKDKKRP